MKSYVDKRRTSAFRAVLLFLAVLSLFLLPDKPQMRVQAAEKTVSAKLPQKTVTVGKQISVTTKTKNVRYTTSNPAVATVSDKGVITGKKAGSAVISVKKDGYQTKKLPVTVRAYGKYPSIPVTLDEMEIELDLETGDGQIFAEVCNRSKSGTVKKIEYTYLITGSVPEASEEEGAPEQDETAGKEKAPEQEDTAEDGSVLLIDEETNASAQTAQKVTFTVKNLHPGERQTVSARGDFAGMKQIEQKLLRVRLYTGRSVLNYNPVKNRMAATWTVKDTTPPVIGGFVGKSSYNSKDVYMVAYSDRKYDFTRFVYADDNMGGKVKLTVNTDQINWKKSGVYTITYTAEDLAGNVAKKSAKVQVRVTGELDRMADSILKSIVKDSWSDQKKAEAIYRYVRRNYSYVDSNDHANWENSALYGLRYGSGNCFVYYSVSRLLLTRCGIPNIEVKRSAGSSHGHWWNYVYIDGGWYHFDTTPRRRRATFCLLTDDQLSDYSKAAGNSHIWDKSLLPKCAKKKISKVEWGKSY